MNLDPALALAFVNSSAPPGGGPDQWVVPDDVGAWLVEAGLVSHAGAPALTPPERRMLLEEARRLRRALAELLDAWTTPGVPPPGMALLELNRALDARPREGLTLVAGAAGYELRERASRASAAGLLARVAEAGALLLAGEGPSRVRRCAAEGCRHWFLDTSKNQRRRWCSMAVCGNRAKVAAHHRRSRRARG